MQKGYLSRAEYQRQRRKRILLSRVKLVSFTALFLVLIVGACTFAINRLLPQATVNTAAGVESGPGTQAVSQAPAPEASKQGRFAEWNTACPWNLIVVNVDNPIPSGYHVITEKYSGTMEVDKRILEPLSDMVRAARADGISLWISSGYRSNQLQTELFQDEISSNLQSGATNSEAREKASRAVAVPGTSEHETGLSVDLNEVSADFEDSQAYRWLQEHGAEYGFVQRYPENKQEITRIINEPWHYRYVGKKAAKVMTQKDLCLEEYAVEIIAGRMDMPA